METKRKRNREYDRAYSKQYYLEHKQESRERRQRFKLEVLSHYSGVIPCCARCGITDLDVLCLDHKNNGGHQHRQQIGGGGKFYTWIKANNFPDGFQVLCANCNMKKWKEVYKNPLVSKL